MRELGEPRSERRLDKIRYTSQNGKRPTRLDEVPDDFKRFERLGITAGRGLAGSGAFEAKGYSKIKKAVGEQAHLCGSTEG